VAGGGAGEGGEQVLGGHGYGGRSATQLRHHVWILS